MTLNPDDWEGFGEEVRGYGHQRGGDSNGKVERQNQKKEKENNSIMMVETKSRLRYFMDNKDRPWNKEKIKVDETEKLKLPTF